ncbi:MAG: tetratricopeptide repeat protein [Candidatus Omnitrophota bacterium]
MNIISFKKWFSEHPALFAVILLLAVCGTAFFNSLDNGFLMDDNPLLIGNRNTNILEFLHLDFSDHEKSAYFRPINHFFILTTLTAFGHDPFGYNLVNLIMHFLACLSVYYLFRILFKDPTIALLTSLIYSLHPINGILINYKTCTSQSFLVIATNLCLINYLSAIEEKNNFSNYVLSLIWFLLALMCHEVGILTPFFLMNILFVLKKYNLRETLFKSIPILTTLICYLLFRMYFFSLKKNVLDNITFFRLSFLEYIASYTKLASWYISKLIFPDGIVLAWEVHHLSNPFYQGVSVVCLSLSIIFLIFILFRKQSAETFALIWLMSGIALVAIVCFARPALGFVIEPHWLCASSIGFFLLVALCLTSLRKILPYSVWLSIIVGLLVFLFAKTNWYNQQWNSQKQYCQYWLTISPNSYWPNFWLGYTYFEEKNYLKAKQHYEKNLGKGVRIFEVYGNLGIVEYNLENYEASISRLNKSLSIEPDIADTHYYLGLNYVVKKDFDTAEEYFLEAVRLDPYFLSPLEQLLRLYEIQGQVEKAVLVKRQLQKLKTK